MSLLLKVFFFFSLYSTVFASLRPPHAGILLTAKTKEGMVYTEIKKMGDYLLVYPMKLIGSKKWSPIALSQISQGKITLTHPKVKKRITLDLVAQKDVFSVPLLASIDPTLIITVEYVYQKQHLQFNYTLTNYQEER